MQMYCVMIYDVVLLCYPEILSCGTHESGGVGSVTKMP